MASPDLIEPDALKGHGKLILNNINPFHLKINEYMGFRSLLDPFSLPKFAVRCMRFNLLCSMLQVTK